MQWVEIEVKDTKEEIYRPAKKKAGKRGAKTLIVF
jgi:hypothetical protein